MAGVSIAISQGAEVLFEQGYGYEHIQEKIEASSKTVYRIGSVTKQFTAVAILKLAEDGKLSLSDPVTKHIPSYPMHGKTITILNLLTHTSGIKSYTSIDSWRKEMSKNKSPQEMLTIFKDLPLEFEPGTQFSYSNSGYFLLGAIVEAVTNLTYANYMETEVFSPAGLKYTHYCTPEKAVTNRALGYQLSPNGLILDSSLSMTQPYSAGAICSTVGDLILWRKALNTNKILSKSSMTQMNKVNLLSDGTPTGYGLGVFIGSLDDHPSIFHGGAINGFSAQTNYYPDDKLSIAVLSNTVGAGATALEQRLTRLILGLKVPIVKELSISSEEILLVVGEYRANGVGTFSVTTKDGVLFGNLNSQPSLPLLSQGNHEFVPDLAVIGMDRNPSIRMHFKVKGNQPAGSMEIMQDGMTIPLTRIK
ncbi:MAG: beta-lactamase family protein [Kofleriaceae bacterium]|nr:beta-lactamase family protein [Kofleriaceae bacterium]